MAFNKNDKADGAKVRRGGAIRRRKKFVYSVARRMARLITKIQIN